MSSTEREVREQIRRAQRRIAGRSTFPADAEARRAFIGNRQQLAGAAVLGGPAFERGGPPQLGSRSNLPQGQLDFSAAAPLQQGQSAGTQQPQQGLTLNSQTPLAPQPLRPFNDPIQPLIDQAGSRPRSTAQNTNTPLALPGSQPTQSSQGRQTSFDQFGQGTGGVNPLPSSGGQAFSAQNDANAQDRLARLLSQANQVELNNQSQRDRLNAERRTNTSNALLQRAQLIREQAAGTTVPNVRARLEAEAGGIEARAAALGQQGLALGQQADTAAAQGLELAQQDQQGLRAIATQQRSQAGALELGEQRSRSGLELEGRRAQLGEQAEGRQFERERKLAEESFNRDVEKLGIQSRLDAAGKNAAARIKAEANQAKARGDNVKFLNDSVKYFDALTGDRFNALNEKATTGGLLPAEQVELEDLQKDRQFFNSSLLQGFDPDEILDGLSRLREIRKIKRAAEAGQ